MRRVLSILLFTLLSSTTHAAEHEAPFSFNLDRGTIAPLNEVEQIRFKALDLDVLAQADATRESSDGTTRFAFPHEVVLSTERFGHWDEIGEISVWRLRFEAAGATLINFGFRDVQMPQGSQLFIYSPEAAGQQVVDTYKVIGPYGSEINQPHGQFWTPNLYGARAVVEVSMPTRLREQFSLTVQQVSHGYRGFGSKAPGYQQVLDDLDGTGKQSCSTLGGARSGSCNQDVACLSEDDPWNLPRQSVGAYQVNGVDFCTGSLVNNTNNDRRMLFMTARHCIGPSDAPNVVIFWNYEWPTCRRPGDSSGSQVNPPDPNQSSSGTTFLAATRNPFSGASCPGGVGDECSDMMLVEVNDEPETEWNLYWSGWDRRPPPTICAQGPGASTDGLCASIHHPGVDEKRITWVDTNIQIGSIAGSNNVHWHPFWHPNPPELPNMPPGGALPPAVTEGGSSGSPLYSADQRLIGVLSGGPAFCGATGASLSDFYGGLFHGWDGLGTPTTRMRDHLDPLGTNPEFIDGVGNIEFSIEADPAAIAQCGFDDVMINLDISEIGGLPDPVSLTTDGLPAGVTELFSTNPVTPPDSSTLTLGNLSAAGAGLLDFNIVGVSGDLTETVPITIALADGAPGAPVLSAPADGAIGVNTNPTISWGSIASAASYDLEIATDSAFNNLVYSASEPSTSHRVASALDPNSEHFVRVRAVNACDSGNWSATVSFTTASLVCTAPALAIPDGPAAGVATDLVINAEERIDSMEISLDIEHDWVGDLLISLEHVESETTIELVNRSDGDGSFGCDANNIRTTVSDDAPLSLQTDCNRGPNNEAFPEAAYRPNDQLSTFSGLPFAGTWRLFVRDQASTFTGTVNEWCILSTPLVPLIFEDRFEDSDP